VRLLPCRAGGHAVAPQHDLLAGDVARSPILDRRAVADRAAAGAVGQHGGKRREPVVMREAALGQLDPGMQRRHRSLTSSTVYGFPRGGRSAPSRAWYSTSGIGLHCRACCTVSGAGWTPGAKTRP